MITSFSHSFFTVFRSLLTLMKPQLRRYVIMPLAINISLFSVTIYYVASRFGTWMDDLLPSWLDWLNWLIWPLFTITIMISVFYTFTIIANIIAAPFNSMLAEKYEQLLRGEINKEDNETFMQLTSRTVAAEFKKLAYVILWLIPLLVATIIPVINLVTPFLWILFAAWMLALEYLDYPMGNNSHRFPQIKQAAHQHKSLSLGLGSGLFIITSIPLLNFLAIPAGVIAATDIYVNKIDKAS